MLVASSQLDAAVATYRAAGVCPAASTPAPCYRLAPGTLVSFSISRGKWGDWTNLVVQLADGNVSTYARTTWAQEDALHPGVALRARIYQGKITSIYVGATGIETKESPIYQQGDLRKGAVFIPVAGLAISAVALLALRRGKRSRLAKQEMLRQTLAEPTGDTSRLTASSSVSVILPLTLRPHPIPTGRPWWMGLIVVGIAIPSLLLRMRTPGFIAKVILAATVVGLLAGVLLHWMYRHRRMLIVDDFTVRFVNLWGLSRVISRVEIAGLAFPVIVSLSAPNEPRLLLLDAAGRCLLSLKRYYPSNDDVAQLAAALRVRLDAKRSRPMLASHLQREIPGAVSWPEAHPFLMLLALLPPILAAVGLFVWMLNGFK